MVEIWIIENHVSRRNLTNIDIVDIVDYKSPIIVRIKIPAQKQISYYDDKLFIRQHSDTIEVTMPKEILAVSKLFEN